MSLDLRHLRAFIAVAEEASYRRAAARLRVAQPALSRTIQQMEALLGARVLDRTTRVVQPTEAGRHLLTQARALLVDWMRMEEDARRVALGQKGELLVGFNDFTISEILPPLVSRFRKAHPEVRVSLSSQPSATMIEMVSDGKLDIGFASGVTAGPKLESVVLRNEAFVCVLPKGHPLASRSRLGPKDLAGQPFVMGAPGWHIFSNAVLQYCERGGFSPNVVQTALNSDGIINFVAVGLGITVYVDRHWLRRRDDVVVRPLQGPQPAFRSVAVWRSKPRSPTLDAMLRLVRDLGPPRRRPR